jgi:hypothetical protein
MLKMKVDPAMCMKTQKMTTKCLAKKHVFARKCTHFTIIDNNRSELLTEDAHVTRKAGEGGRKIGSSEEHGAGFRGPDDSIFRWPDRAACQDIVETKGVNGLASECLKALSHSKK